MRGVDLPMTWKGLSPGRPIPVRVFLGSISKMVTGKSISFPSVLKLLTGFSPFI